MSVVDYSLNNDHLHDEQRYVSNTAFVRIPGTDCVGLFANSTGCWTWSRSTRTERLWPAISAQWINLASDIHITTGDDGFPSQHNRGCSCNSLCCCWMSLFLSWLLLHGSLLLFTGNGGFPSAIPTITNQHNRGCSYNYLLLLLLLDESVFVV
jgi:hypothetical protein